MSEFASSTLLNVAFVGLAVSGNTNGPSSHRNSVKACGNGMIRDGIVNLANCGYHAANEHARTSARLTLNFSVTESSVDSASEGRREVAEEEKYDNKLKSVYMHIYIYYIAIAGDSMEIR